MTPEALSPKMRRRIQSLAAEHGAEAVRLFGSFARGDAGPDSDLDLLVRMREDRTLIDLVALTQELSALLGRPVDVVTEDGLSPALKDEILAEAVAL